MEGEAGNGGKTGDRDSKNLGLDGNTKHEARRGSHLLAAAGIDFERRRRHSHQNADSKVYQDGNQLVVEGEDGKLTRLEILSVTEKMGNMRKAVPTLPIPIAVLLCIINTFLPGIGTFIGAGSLLCCGRCRHEKTSRGIRYGIIAGLLQLLTAVLIFGWIYSIIYGVQMIQDSVTKAAIAPNNQSDKKDNKDGDNDNQAWA